MAIIKLFGRSSGLRCISVIQDAAISRFAPRLARPITRLSIPVTIRANGAGRFIDRSPKEQIRHYAKPPPGFENFAQPQRKKSATREETHVEKEREEREGRTESRREQRRRVEEEEEPESPRRRRDRDDEQDKKNDEEGPRRKSNKKGMLLCMLYYSCCNLVNMAAG